MKLKHYRHLSTQIALIGSFLLLLAVISTIATHKNRQVNAANDQQKQAEAELNNRLAEANQMQSLDAFDLLVTNTGEKPADPSTAKTQSLRVPDFGQVDVQTGDSGRLFVLKGSEGIQTLVKSGSQSTVHRNSAAAAAALASKSSISSINPSSDTSPNSTVSNATLSKISGDLQETIRLGKKDQKVIVRFKNPEKNLDKSDTRIQRQQKRDKHNQRKDKLRKKHSRKVKIDDTKDLYIVDGVAATVADGQAIQELAADPNIEKIELDGEVKASLNGSVKEIGVDKVWSQFTNDNQALTGFGMRVAVLDTGIDYRHPDLGGCIGPNCKVLGGYDFYYNDNDPMDVYGHGTHVAATVAGKGTLRGVAPDAKLYAYKVLGDDGYGYDSDIIAAINRSTDPDQDGNTNDHVDVISMSLGGYGDPDDVVSLAVDAASAIGVVSAIAAGNSGPGTAKIGNINSPGTARTALTVAASCEKSLVKVHYRCYQPIASFSSRGPLIWKGQDLLKPDISAPGVEICAAKTPVSAYYWVPNCIDSQHYSLSGTSMATPHIAGVVALIRQSQPELTPQQIKDLIKSTAINLGSGLTYNDQGAGLINPTAIIPTNAVVSLEPRSWDIVNRPTTATSTFTQSFTIKSTDTTLSTVDVSFNFNQTGLTLSSNKSQLNLSNGATDSFTVTATIDNDQIQNISLYGSIIISAASKTRGVIPITIESLSDFSLSPSDQLDFGVSDPTLSNWTSEKQSITITNHRTDKAITPTISLSGFKAGVSLKLDPATSSIAPGASQVVQLWLEVNNQLLVNDDYIGNLTVANGVASQSIYAGFKKYYIYEIKDDSGQLVGGYYWTHDRSQYTYWGEITDNSTIYYTLKPLIQDMVVYYPNVVSGDNQHLYTVVKEGVQSAGGKTTVNFSRSEAKNKVKLQATGIDNQPVRYLNTVFQYMMYLPKFGSIGVGNGGYGYLNRDSDVTETYISDLSTDYRIVSQYIHPAYRYSSTNYVFYDDFTGLTGDRTKTNTDTDFYRVDLKYPAISSGEVTPYLWACPLWEHCFRSYSGSPDVKLPTNHILYTTKPPENTLFQVSSNWWRVGCNEGVICPTAFVSSNFATDNNKQRFYDWLPDRQGQTIYMGLGPAYWAVKFANTDKQIILQPYFRSPLTALLHQDYGVNEYDQINLSLIDQSGNLVATDYIPALHGVYDTVYPYGNLTTMTAPNLTRYTLKSGELTYYSGKSLLKGQATLQFDLGKTDPNPPAIKRFNFWANNQRAERYDPAVENRFEFDLDPVGGTLASAKLSYSLDDVTYTDVNLTNQGTVYKAILPGNLKPATHLTLKLLVTDVATNSLEYKFELLSPDSEDKGPPTVNITSPTQSSYLRDVVKVDIAAFDDRAIKSLDIYANNLRVGTLTSAPYIFNWNTHPVGRQIDNRLTVVATDTAGQQSRTSIDVVVDNIPPYLALQNVPGDVAGTINLDLLTYDAGGLQSVKSYVDGQYIGEASFAYTSGQYRFYRTSWDTDRYPEGSVHSFKMVATDKAGHTTSTDEYKMIVRRTPLKQNKSAPVATVSASASNNQSTAPTATASATSVSDTVNAKVSPVAPEPTPVLKPKIARKLNKKELRSQKAIESKIKNLTNQESRINRTVQGYIVKTDQYKRSLTQTTNRVRQVLLNRQLASTERLLKRSIDQLTAVQNTLRIVREQLDRLLYE
ncbi:MAG: Peptidase S8 and S53 subtilisin kexin sedolisin [Candidatus Berkelbacteria bacterium Gr01-1014_85]|uniref:Peptidase S8 and S53 subtilisin kexin sedolisin n=1 Tax=Candidatus Berkelbacteria bacterium Gr01-1014_85 TaxID=2017150 RepID=A0A554JDF6_9BACT|nr:MAG: Peptidase S8 and S53 subtilisin kexin sedolisin [Candidatus Berkelbacteria bacterium Gr01-1014_85]